MINKNGIWDLNEASKGHSHSWPLANAMKELLPPQQPVLDLGCGLGFYADYLWRRGYTVQAFEGTPNIGEIAIFRHIKQHDLTTTLPSDAKGNVICLEVGEHIPKEHEQAFIDNITNACTNILILSWALPNQGGRGHVNEQPAKYVIEQVEKRGFMILEKETNVLRANAENCWWFANTIHVFKRV